MNEAQAPDAIDSAISASEAPPVSPVQLLEGRIQLQGGRIAFFALPVDLTDAEWIAVVEQLLRGYGEIARRRQGPASRIILPGR